jgi:hypothetical protein
VPAAVVLFTRCASPSHRRARSARSCGKGEEARRRFDGQGPPYPRRCPGTLLVLSANPRSLLARLLCAAAGSTEVLASSDVLAQLRDAKLVYTTMEPRRAGPSASPLPLDATDPLLSRKEVLALARAAHPDRGGSTEAFAAVMEAYAARHSLGAAQSSTESQDTTDTVGTLQGLLSDAFAQVLEEAGCFVCHAEASRPRVLRAKAPKRRGHHQKACPAGSPAGSPASSPAGSSAAVATSDSTGIPPGITTGTSAVNPAGTGHGDRHRDGTRSSSAEANTAARRTAHNMCASAERFDYYSPSALSIYTVLARPSPSADDCEGAATTTVECHFPSPHALASAVVASLPSRAYATLRQAHVGGQGFINLTLAHRLLAAAPPPSTAQQGSRAGGAAAAECPICGGRFSAGRGIRAHLQSSRHDLTMEQMQMVMRAVEARLSAIEGVYEGPVGADGGGGRGGGDEGDEGGEGDEGDVGSGSEGGGRSIAAQRVGSALATKEGDLDPGLMACRDGQLEQLKGVVFGSASFPSAAVTDTAVDAAVDAAAEPGRSLVMPSLLWDARTVIDRNGSCALHYAAGGGHVAVVAFLVGDLGVDINQRVVRGRRDGRTALHWACRNGHLEMARWLVDNGAGYDATNDGTTPFHWAAWQGHRSVCEWLVDRYAFGASREDRGDTRGKGRRR